ncbi:MAG: hypothetical protein Q9160_009005 [Pyrenula sp. 1 TL-2023]
MRRAFESHEYLADLLKLVQVQCSPSRPTTTATNAHLGVFSKLPKELRLQIYEEVLQVRNFQELTTAENSHHLAVRSSQLRGTTNILRVSRAVYTEAKEVVDGIPYVLEYFQACDLGFFRESYVVGVKQFDHSSRIPLDRLQNVTICMRGVSSSIRDLAQTSKIRDSVHTNNGFVQA